ncbi:pre-rRNA-processing protein TSR2 homolog [Sceloporus undulatus]|uniref:pre-rRNA-processing protein TSR2 homolog n=1 Tax=Sceloporus undulatus TaxID=8520 RepID=UPI001C4B0DC5|nr:pre-rRNA-processing protein TSR2 homolog [Sceloporus undulatus]
MAAGPQRPPAAWEPILEGPSDGSTPQMAGVKNSSCCDEWENLVVNHAFPHFQEAKTAAFKCDPPGARRPSMIRRAIPRGALAGLAAAAAAVAPRGRRVACSAERCRRAGQLPVLRIAVENGFGGMYSQEKAEWMVGAVEQYFQSNADLEPDEIEDFLAELMNNEFDTMVEDGSLAQVSQQLCLFFKQCQHGDGAAVHDALVHLAQKQQEAKMVAAKSQPADQSSSEEEDEQEPEEEAMECSATPSMNGPTSSPPPSSNLDVDDGWTLVTKKKK